MQIRTQKHSLNCASLHLVLSSMPAAHICWSHLHILFYNLTLNFMVAVVNTFNTKTNSSKEMVEFSFKNVDIESICYCKQRMKSKLSLFSECVETMLCKLCTSFTSHLQSSCGMAWYRTLGVKGINLGPTMGLYHILWQAVCQRVSRNLCSRWQLKNSFKQLMHAAGMHVCTLNMLVYQIQLRQRPARDVNNLFFYKWTIWRFNYIHSQKLWA